MAFERELTSVHEWLDATDRIALQHFAVNVPTEIKADGTPVTAADQAIERALRNAIASAFPSDAIVGEEFGSSSGARRWIIDPIDGTKSYARGVPVFATLIALEIDGSLVLGCVSAPALGARWWATTGGGAFCNGRAIVVSSVSRIDEAHLCTGGVDWARGGLDGLVASVARVRGFGDFWGHMLVAQGSMDVMVEFAPLEVWDVAAPRAIVLEAGGAVSSHAGDARAVEGPIVTTNGLLHEDVLRALGTGGA
ncbi:MAG: inositol monophosphatase [Actinomycetota bacterium]